MNCLAIFILMIVTVRHESLGQEEKPTCPNRKALLFSPDLMGQLPQNWYVNRLTIMETLPPTAKKPPNENCCHPLAYLADCLGDKPIGGIHVFREWQQDGGYVKITKAYSSKFKNIAEFWEEQSIYDTDLQNPKLIYTGFLRFMFLHYEGKQKVREIKSYKFPRLILFATAQWIEISEKVVNENRVDDINKEIDQYLGGDHTMVLIPTKLPFKV